MFTGKLENVFVTYQSDSVQFDFKKKSRKIVAEKIVAGQSPIPYSLHPSFSLIQEIPLACRLSSRKTVKWLIAHEYSPYIQEGKVYFRRKELPLLQETPLHQAATNGEMNNLVSLIDQGVSLDAQDASKKTALYLAVTQGHENIVFCLLNRGADPTIVGEEGDTVLHVCAFYGHKALLEKLLSFPQVKNLLYLQDSDGKQTIHKALWADPKPDIVELLLKEGADPNAINHFGYTPLHWAAKHGHIESADLLIKAGAKLDIVNQNGALSFDLAISWEQDDFLHSFLGTKQRLIINQSRTQDTEGYFSKCLLEAKKQNLPEEQILYLLKISDLYAQKKNLPIAAKILNCAVAIFNSLENPSTIFRQYLFARLELIEQQFIRSTGVNVLIKRKKSIPDYRDLLQAARKRAERNQSTQPIAEVLKQLTQEFKQILLDLIEETMDLLGPPPVKWACIGMGSMSRDEMCPYSDIEFAFLLEKETSGAMEYFRTLSRILEFKVISLGETKFPIFGDESPTPDGFCMDSGGNTPLGVKGVYELIGTPAQLAKFQNVQWIDSNIILPNAMSNVCLIAGTEKLLSKYTVEKNKVQSQTSKEKRYDEILAMRLIAGHLQEFAPDLSKEKEKEPAFGVKKELYRPFQEILSCLAIFYHLQEKSTFGRIDELVTKNIFSQKGAENLKRVIAKVMQLRVQVHLFYKDEKEFLCHPEVGKTEEPQLLYMNEGHIAFLQEIYQVLLPFHRSASDFYQTRDASSFNQCEFLDESPIIQGIAFQKALQYSKAEEAIQQAVSLNPNDFVAVSKLVNLQCILKNGKDGLSHAEKVLQIVLEKYGKNHPYAAGAYQNVGMALEVVGRAIDGVDYLHKAIRIYEKIFGSSNAIVASAYRNISFLLTSIGKHQEALEYSLKAYKIYLLCYGKNHADTANICNIMGCIVEELGDTQKGLDFYRESLEIRLHLFGEKHPLVAVNYNNIGLALQILGDFQEAMKYLNKSLEIRLRVYGEDHPSVATSYDNMGKLCLELEKKEEALEYHQKALKIHMKCYGEDHPATVVTYSNLGMALQAAGKTKEALDLLYKALNLDISHYGIHHRNVAAAYNNIGQVLCQKGSAQEGLDLLKKALALSLNIYGENHPKVAASYYNIGLSQKENDSQEAFNHLQKALKIWLGLYGENHRQVAKNLYQIGWLLYTLGHFEEAFKYYERELDIGLILYGANHKDNATSYNNMGLAQKKLGNPKESLILYKKALDIHLEIGDGNSSEVAAIYNNIGSAYCSLALAEEAIEAYTTALTIFSSLYRSDHNQVKIIQGHIEYIQKEKKKQEVEEMLASIYGGKQINLGEQNTQMGHSSREQKQYDKALEYYEKALEIYFVDLQMGVGDYSDIALGYANVGFVCVELTLYDKALENFQNSCKIGVQIYGENHLNLSTNYFWIGTLYNRLEDYSKALEYYEKVLQIETEILGEDHIDLAIIYKNISSTLCKQGEYTRALVCYERTFTILCVACNTPHAKLLGILDDLITCAQQLSAPSQEILKRVHDLCVNTLGPQHKGTQKISQLITA